MKILWFAISYAFEKDVWDKWYENTLICNFLCFSKGCMGEMKWKYFDLQFLMLLKRMYGINDMKILSFAISYAFQKDVWDINHMKILSFASSYAFQKDVGKYFDLQFLMLFKRMYGINYMKILWFANSYAF